MDGRMPWYVVLSDTALLVRGGFDQIVGRPVSWAKLGMR